MFRLLKLNDKKVDSSKYNDSVRVNLYNYDISIYFDNSDNIESEIDVDEIIETAVPKETLPSKYSHDWLDDNGKNDWDYWKVIIQEKNKQVNRLIYLFFFYKSNRIFNKISNHTFTISTNITYFSKFSSFNFYKRSFPKTGYR